MNQDTKSLANVYQLLNEERTLMPDVRESEVYQQGEQAYELDKAQNIDALLTSVYDIYREHKKTIDSNKDISSNLYNLITAIKQNKKV